MATNAVTPRVLINISAAAQGRLRRRMTSASWSQRLAPQLHCSRIFRACSLQRKCPCIHRKLQRTFAQKTEDRDAGVAQAEEESASREAGVVEWFNVDKGYGFILAHGDGAQLYVHRTQIQIAGGGAPRSGLGAGEEVEFVRCERQGKLQAWRVSGPSGARVEGGLASAAALRALSKRLGAHLLRPQTSRDEQHHQELMLSLAGLSEPLACDLFKLVPASCVEEVYDGLGHLQTSRVLGAALRALVGQPREVTEDRLEEGARVWLVQLDRQAGAADARQLGLLLSVARSLGQWQCATRLLDHALASQELEVTPKLWFMVLGALKKAGRGVEALAMFKRMQHAGVVPNQWACSDVLMALVACNELDSACQFARARCAPEAGGTFPDNVALRQLVRALQGSGDGPERALEVLQNMVLTGETPQVATVKAATEVLGAAGQWEEAKLLVESMSDAGVAPRRNLYNVLLDVMGDAGQWQRARELFEGLAAEGLPPDTTAFSTLMHGLGVAGKWQEAETVLDEMKAAGVRPSTVTYTILVDTLGKCGQWERAQLALGEMQRLKLKPDLVTYNVVVDALGKAGKVQDVKTHMQRMRNRGMEPDGYTYNSLMQAYIKEDGADATDKVEGVLAEMQRHRVHPDLHTYCLLLKVFAAAKHTDKVFEIEERMRSGRATLPMECSNALIDAYGRCEQVEAAQAVWSRMVHSGARPSSSSYTVWVHALCRSSQWERATQVMAAMSSEGHMLDVELYTSLVYALSKCGRWEHAEEVMKEMNLKGFTPDLYTYTALISQLAKAGHWRSVEHHMAELKRMDIKTDYVIYSTLIKALGVEYSDKQVSQELHTIMQDSNEQTRTKQFK